MSEPHSASAPGARYFPFDSLVDRYERYRIGYSGEVYEALEEAGVSAGRRVLDVGCGTGLSASPFAEAGCRVTGVDSAPEMLARARRRLPEATFNLASAEMLPYRDASFDAAISAQAFHWFESRRALAEMVRVVRPGGVVAVWWKTVMRGDPLRMFRAQAARTLDIELDEPILGESFPEFDDDLLVGQRLRVIPWLVATSVEDFIGYESSRGRANVTFGERMPAYLQALRTILGPPETTYRLTFVHYLYLATVPAASAS